MPQPHRPDTSRSHSWRDWLPLALGLVFALAALEFARTHLLVKLEEAALGTQTQNVYVAGGGSRVLCQDARDSRECLASYETSHRTPAILWLGNSQLPAINRYKPGDGTAPTLLHDALRARGHYVATYAMPNANLMEHALMFAALAPRYDIRLLILPVFLDDIREQGIRPQIAELQEEPRVRKHVEQSAIWPHIAPLLARNGDTEAKEPAGFQQTFEAGFNARLEKVWPLWRNRANLRGLFGILTHTLRNKVLGINAQSKRKVDPNVYREKMATLAAALTHARDLKIKVLLYVPPFRQDIQGPYVDSDYAMLKADLQVLAANYGAHFANLESIVPGPEWGNVVDSIFGFQDYDFMHFTGEGHRRHAQALDAVLRKMGF